MANSNLAGVQREFPIERDDAPRYVPWIIAVMVYLATLAAAGALALDTAVSRWDRHLRTTLTVQIPPGAPAQMEARIEAALEALRAHPDVAQARALERADVAALLEPWMGSASLSPDLPMPGLIDVRLRAGGRLDGLSARLAAIDPGIVLDDHRGALDNVVRFARSMQLVALAIVLLVAIAAAATVMFATRAGLAVHHDVIEVLHLIGARDNYIARYFQGQMLRQGLRGGFLGLGLAAITMFLLARATAELQGPFLPVLRLGFEDWALVALLPLGAGLITMLTARSTVLRVLARLP
jgi:cell division transport system permease protein